MSRYTRVCAKLSRYTCARGRVRDNAKGGRWWSWLQHAPSRFIVVFLQVPEVAREPTIPFSASLPYLVPVKSVSEDKYSRLTKKFVGADQLGGQTVGNCKTRFEAEVAKTQTAQSGTFVLQDCSSIVWSLCCWPWLASTLEKSGLACEVCMLKLHCPAQSDSVTRQCLVARCCCADDFLGQDEGLRALAEELLVGLLPVPDLLKKCEELCLQRCLCCKLCERQQLSMNLRNEPVGRAQLQNFRALFGDKPNIEKNTWEVQICVFPQKIADWRLSHSETLSLEARL